MTISETRKWILELIADKDVKIIKDLEDKTNLKRAGILRHLKESEEKGWITKEKKGRETHLKITRCGLDEIGRTDPMNLVKELEISNRDLEILKELFEYSLGISQLVFSESMSKKMRIDRKDTDEMIKKLIEKRLISNKDVEFVPVDDNAVPVSDAMEADLINYYGKEYLEKIINTFPESMRQGIDVIQISQFSIAVLIENDIFKSFFIRHCKKSKDDFIIRTLESFGVEGTIQNIEQLKTDTRLGFDDEMLIDLVAFQNANTKIVDYLFNNNLSIEDVTKDDSLFKVVEEIINDSIASVYMNRMYFEISQMVYSDDHSGAIEHYITKTFKK